MKRLLASREVTARAKLKITIEPIILDSAVDRYEDRSTY